MASRGINTYAILARREAQHDFVAADDFTLATPDVAASPRLPPGTLPYCVDLPRERLLLTHHDPATLHRVLSAAFMFSAQLETAHAVTSIPFERLDELPPPQAAPTFVFSPGRTGSTLLARLLAAAGQPCASEPDVFTQILRFTRDEVRLLPADTRHRLALASIAALGHTLGGGALIKLRSQCNGRPLVLTDAAPGCRVIFMLRGIPAWAHSRHRSFLEPGETVAAILRQAIDALDKLAFSGAAFDILWFETLVANPQAALRVCAPHLQPDPARTAAVMALDSQAGTTVARDLVASLPTQDGFWADFRTCWSEARAGAEWRPETEALLAAMWDR
jgi:hypothetical protein